MRDYTKFFTPFKTAEFMVSLLKPQDKDAILEPSAGNGSLIRAIKAVAPKSIVFAFEKDKTWEQDLRAIANIVVIKDFLDIPIYAKLTSCVANPPFGNETDLLAHFNHICKHVKEGGKIVMIVPKEFTPENILLNVYPIENWSTNSDGTKTEIKIIEFINPSPTPPHTEVKGLDVINLSELKNAFVSAIETLQCGGTAEDAFTSLLCHLPTPSAGLLSCGCTPKQRTMITFTKDGDYCGGCGKLIP